MNNNDTQRTKPISSILNAVYGPDLKPDFSKLSRRSQTRLRNIQVDNFIKDEKSHQKEQNIQIMHFKYEEPRENLIIPRFQFINPLSVHPFLSSDGIRHYIQYRTPIHFEYLKPKFTPSSLKEKPATSTQIRMAIPQNIVPIQKKLSPTFKTVINPKTVSHVSFINNAFNPITHSHSSIDKSTLPVMPSIYVVNQQIIDFEKSKLLNPSHECPRDIRITMPAAKPMSHFHLHYLSNIVQLPLEQGEFVIVENIDDHPIIQPLVGMCSRFDVLIDNINAEDSHPYDKRIPLTRLYPHCLQPFHSPLPRNQYVMTLTNTVCISAVAPYSSHSTDFILAMNSNRSYIVQFPSHVYVSTPVEPIVKFPKSKSLIKEKRANFFNKWPHITVEQLCAHRSIVIGLRELDKFHIKRLRLSCFSSEGKKIYSRLHPQMKAAISKYVHLINQTPWNRAARLQKLRLSRAKYRDDSAVPTAQNVIMSILESGEDVSDFEDMKLSNEEEEEGIIPEADEKTDFIDYCAEPEALHPTRINWKEFGLDNLPKRKVLKRITYEVIDGVAVAHVEWIRDPERIAELSKPQSRISRKQSREFSEEEYGYESD